MKGWTLARLKSHDEGWKTVMEITRHIDLPKDASDICGESRRSIRFKTTQYGAEQFVEKISDWTLMHWRRKLEYQKERIDRWNEQGDRTYQYPVGIPVESRDRDDITVDDKTWVITYTQHNGR